LVEVLTPADDQGRVRLVSYWRDGEQVRGQVSFTTLAAFTADAAEHGLTVRVLTCAPSGGAAHRAAVPTRAASQPQVLDQLTSRGPVRRDRPHGQATYVAENRHLPPAAGTHRRLPLSPPHHPGDPQ
jgi:hypothetical protein